MKYNEPSLVQPAKRLSAKPLGASMSFLEVEWKNQYEKEID